MDNSFTLQELLARECACLGPLPVCRCMQQRGDQQQRVAVAAGITTAQAARAILEYERCLVDEFPGVRCALGRSPRTG